VVVDAGRLALVGAQLRQGAGVADGQSDAAFTGAALRHETGRKQRAQQYRGQRKPERELPETVVAERLQGNPVRQCGTSIGDRLSGLQRPGHRTGAAAEKLPGGPAETCQLPCGAGFAWR